VDRLVFIARRCPLLAVDAYRLALNELRANSMAHQRYSEIVKELNEVLAGDKCTPLQPDLQWVETTQKRARALQERLDLELKNYKSNLIKESIRVNLLLSPFLLWVCLI
jgi:COP9 signalosome complex subunit 1